MASKDNIYQDPLSEIIDFQFDETVTHVFDDMIQRSVPGYANLIRLLTQISQRFVKPDAICYDLGCSLGSFSLNLALQSSVPLKIKAIDSSEAMLKRFAELIKQHEIKSDIGLVYEDILQTRFENACLVVMNLTLQFIAPEFRLPLLNKIYDGLNPGGSLIISEKISFSDPQVSEHMTQWHEDFKRDNGYSELEISQKRTALENVLIPDTLETHITRLKDTGFKLVVPWFQSLNFISLIAIK